MEETATIGTITLSDVGKPTPLAKGTGFQDLGPRLIPRHQLRLLLRLVVKKQTKEQDLKISSRA